MKSFRTLASFGAERFSARGRLVGALALSLSLMQLSSLVQAQNTGAREFRSVSTTAVLLDGPSAKANKKFIAPKGMPLLVVSTVEPFIKVRDADGFEGFIEKKFTASQRTVLATTLVNLRSAAAEGGATLLQAERGVVFDLLEAPAGGWIKVKHAEGQIGYLRSSEVWGL